MKYISHEYSLYCCVMNEVMWNENGKPCYNTYLSIHIPTNRCNRRQIIYYMYVTGEIKYTSFRLKCLFSSMNSLNKFRTRFTMYHIRILYSRDPFAIKGKSVTFLELVSFSRTLPREGFIFHSTFYTRLRSSRVVFIE